MCSSNIPKPPNPIAVLQNPASALGLQGAINPGAAPAAGPGAIPKVATDQDPAITAASDAERRRRAGAKGYSSTVIASGSGAPKGGLKPLPTILTTTLAPPPSIAPIAVPAAAPVVSFYLEPNRDGATSGRNK